jgi:hypothetical protein
MSDSSLENVHSSQSNIVIYRTEILIQSEVSHLITISHFKPISLFGGDYRDPQYPGFRYASPGAMFERSFRAKKTVYISKFSFTVIW